MKLNSQTTIKGIVCDSITFDTLPFATLKIYNMNKDSLIYSTISDSTGQFQIKNITNEKCIIQCSYIGYKTWNQLLILNRKEVKLTIKMSPDINNFKTITIKGERKLSEHFNRTIFKPDSSLIKNSSNALDMLKNVNSIEVDPISGTANLIGESNTLVLVNNIPISRQKSIFSIKPEEIDHIEIIHNPSSKYDKEYSGVINIILKKEKKNGISLSNWTGVFYNLGVFNFDFEWATPQKRIFISSENKYRLIKYEKYHTWQINNTDYYHYNSKELNSKFEKLEHVLTTGTDFFINSNNTLNFTYRTDLIKYVNNSDKILSYIFNNQSNNQQILSNYKGQDFLNNISLYYEKKFGMSENMLNIDFNYYIMSTHDNTRYNYIYEIPANNFYRKENENNNKNSFNTKIDYTAYINDIWSFDAGYNLNMYKISNNFLSFYKYLFSYKEFKNSFYYDIYADYEKCSFWGGIRYENSNIIINDTIPKQINKFMPNVGISWSLNNVNKISVSYDNFLTRPTIWELNPFTYFTDSLNISSGNPFLVPSVTNNIEFKHTYIKKDKQISSSLYYEWSNNLIDNLTTYFQGKTYTSYSNISTNKSYGTKINMAISLNDKLKLNGLIRIFYSNYKHLKKENKGFSYIFNGNLTYDISKNIFAGLYMLTPYTKTFTLQGYKTTKFKINQVYLGMKVLRDKGKIYLLIFNLPGDNNTLIIKDIDYISTEKNNVKSISAGIYFTYSFFNSKNIKKLKRDYHMEKDSKALF